MIIKMLNRLLSITNVIQFDIRLALEYQQMKKYANRHYNFPITTECRVIITLVRQAEKGETSVRQILDDRADKGYQIFVS